VHALQHLWSGSAAHARSTTQSGRQPLLPGSLTTPGLGLCDVAVHALSLRSIRAQWDQSWGVHGARHEGPRTACAAPAGA
jgi:hypothetical protein